MGNIITLYKDLINKSYRHGTYQAFKINDPKPRDIHKANVRDRLLHHGIYRCLYPYFDYKFIYDSYSCRDYKGTHRALNRFREFGKNVSCNNTKTAWVLKCDISKFFANIDHQILKDILWKYIKDEDIIWLLDQVIDSFNTQGRSNLGLPLGNLTSQLLINIYMNEFDQFVKRQLKIKYYIRYADDFVIFSEDRQYLVNLIPQISEYLKQQLKLSLNPNKLSIKTLASGIDFLGWVHFPDHRILRTATKKRMFKRLSQNQNDIIANSYLGLLRHGNTHQLVKEVTNRVAV